MLLCAGLAACFWVWACAWSLLNAWNAASVSNVSGLSKKYLVIWKYSDLDILDFSVFLLCLLLRVCVCWRECGRSGLFDENKI
jgi:hypothetical protein